MTEKMKNKRTKAGVIRSLLIEAYVTDDNFTKAYCYMLIGCHLSFRFATAIAITAPMWGMAIFLTLGKVSNSAAIFGLFSFMAGLVALFVFLVILHDSLKPTKTTNV